MPNILMLLPWIGRTAISPFLLILLAGLIIAYLIEMRRHKAALHKIPIRVHVNGTRGKSSVTRLIAAGLRAGNIRTFAKTTGSAPVMILPDGREEPVLRDGAANIREQLSIIRRAAEEAAEVLVLECMAIRPDLQQISEKRIVHSTIGVITNIRPDHLEVMGPTLDNVAIALSNTIPRGGRLFSNEARFAGFLREKAGRRGSSFHLTDPERTPSAAEMEGFDHVEIPENVALALDVCEEIGVDREKALKGMYTVTPDVGATTRTHMKRGDRELTFINALAANDPESTVYLWQLLDLHEGGERNAIVLISNRADRMRRAVDMARMIATEMSADWYVAVGDRARTFVDLAARNGVARAKLVNMGGKSPAEVLAKLFELGGQQCTTMGIGNMGGFGSQFVREVEKESKRHDS
jgi:poly-gamma-glutamate synthase PgsB/CapB